MSLMERLAIIIDANGTAAVNEFHKVGVAAEKDLGGAEAGAARLGGSMQKAGGIAVVGGALILGAMGKTAQAYEQAEEASLKLENSVQNNAKTAGSSVEPYKKMAKAIEDTTAMSHVSAEAAAGQLVQMKLTEGQISTLLPLVADYAQKTGQDMADAALQVGKAVEGQTKGLKAHGIVIDDAAYKTNHFAGVMDALNGSVKGAGAQFAGTFAGQLQQTKNKIHDVEEGVGKGAVKAFGQWLDGIKAVSDALQKLSPGQQDLIGETLTWGAGLATLGGALFVVSGSVLKFRVNLLALKAAQQEQIVVDGEEVAANTAVSASFGTMALAAAAGAASFGLTVTAGNALIGAFNESKQASKDAADGFATSSAGAKQLAKDIGLVKHATTGKSVGDLLLNGPRLWLEYKGSVHDAREELKAFDERMAALAAKDPAAAWRTVQSAATGANVSVGDLTASMPKLMDAMNAYRDSANGAANKTDELATETRSLIDAQNTYRGDVLSTVAAHQALLDSEQHVIDAKQKLIDVTQGVSAASEAGQAAIDAEAGAEDSAASASASYADAKAKLTEVLGGVAAGSQEATDAIDALTSAEDANRSAGDSVLMAQRKANEERRKHGKNSIDAKVASDELLNAQDALTRSGHSLTKQQTTTNDILHGYPKTSKEARDALNQFDSAQRNNTTAQKNLTKAREDEQHILHGFPATSKEVQTAQRDLRDAGEEVKTALLNQDIAVLKLTDDYGKLLPLVDQLVKDANALPKTGAEWAGLVPSFHGHAGGGAVGSGPLAFPPSPFTGGTGTVSPYTGDYGGKSGFKEKQSLFGDHNVINFGHVLNPAEIEHAAAKLHTKTRINR